MLRVGVIGCGFIGNAHAAALTKMSGVELVAIADLNSDAGEKAAGEFKCRYYSDAEKMMKEMVLDIVDVSLPTFLHEKYVLLAAENKIHVICEKPFSLKIEEAENMIKATEEASVHFMIAQVIRFWPEYVKAKELYEQGVFGNIKMVYANRLAQHPDWSTWHRDVSKSGGGLFDLHIHDIDYMCHLFGAVDRVYSIGDKDQNECWNHVTTSLSFKNGSRAVVEGAFEMTDHYPFTMSMRITGEKASYDYNFSAGFNLENAESARRSAILYRNGNTPEVLIIDEFDPYQKELEYFVDCLENNNPVTKALPENSLYVLTIIKAIQKSLESGEVIAFD